MCVCVSHRFLDLAAEDVDAEDLGVVVALGESETVALGCPVVTPNTEQDLIDGVVRDLSPCLRVQQPETEKKRKREKHFKFERET